VYTTRGLKEQARFALENAHQIVDYFSEVFQIDYPLPKVDLLAVHEFVGFPQIHLFRSGFLAFDLLQGAILSNSYANSTLRSLEPWKIGAL
jgi:hypothetical protein